MATPNLDELKAAAGSENIATCFKLLFSSELVEQRNLLMRLEVLVGQLREKIQKFDRTQTEVLHLGPYHEQGVDALGCLEKMQIVERDILQSLEGTLGLIRDGIEQQEEHVTLMEINEDLSDG